MLSPVGHSTRLRKTAATLEVQRGGDQRPEVTTNESAGYHWFKTH